MTRLWLIRHGPTHQRAFTGWRDVPADLSDTAAISRLQMHLPPHAPVVSSDLSRAIDTASAIAGPRLRLPHDAALREFDFGAWDGLEFDAVTARDPVLSRRYWEEPGDTAAPGGESWDAAAARIDAAVDRLLDLCSAPDLIIVAHFGMILTQIRRALDCTAKEVLSHRIDPLSVTRIDTGAERWQVGPINHLP